MAARLARSPLVIAWWPVAVVPCVLIGDAAISPDGHPLTAVNVAAAFVGCLPLVLRRRVSFAAQAPLIVAGTVLVMWRLHPASTVVAIPMVAVYELALAGSRRRSVCMSIALVPCVFVAVLPFGGTGAHLASIVVRNLLLCLLAVALGDIARTRGEATERTVTAREQETLRRISDERLRIAHEIHDVVAHAMTAINVQAGVAAHLLERDPDQVHGALRDIKRTSGEALAELRSTLDVLRDPAGSAPLAPAGRLADLEPLTRGLGSAGVAVRLDVADVGDVPGPVQSAGYRIVQEALTNVARHAEARRAWVRVGRDAGAVTIEVSDDGRGCAEDATAAAGNGLRGMRERAAALGGTVETAPRIGGGWSVRARLPVTATPVIDAGADEASAATGVTAADEAPTASGTAANGPAA